MNKLKPCPFCGATPELREYKWSESVIQYSVWCNRGHELKTHALNTYSYENKEDAIAAWNERADT